MPLETRLMAVEVIYLWRALPFCSRATKEELVQILGMALPPTALPYHQALRAWLLGGMLSSLKRTAEAERVSKGAQGFFHTGFFAGGGEFSRDNKWMHVKQIVCKLLGGGVWGYAPPPPPPPENIWKISARRLNLFLYPAAHIHVGCPLKFMICTLLYMYMYVGGWGLATRLVHV